MAARLHGFNRTIKDVVKVVRLSRSTILQRLTDFGKTASSKLTVDEFNKIDLEEEADPPSFTKARQRAKQSQIYDEKMKLNSPDLLAQLALTQERVEVVLTNRKLIEDDIVSRETVLPELSERRKLHRMSLPIHKMNSEDQDKSLDISSENPIDVKGEGEFEPELPESGVETNDTSSQGVNPDNVTSEILDVISQDGASKECASTGSGESKLDKKKIAREEKKEKEFKETIAMFNQTQQGFESESDKEESDNEGETKVKKEGRCSTLKNFLVSQLLL